MIHFGRNAIRHATLGCLSDSNCPFQFLILSGFRDCNISRPSLEIALVILSIPFLSFHFQLCFNWGGAGNPIQNLVLINERLSRSLYIGGWGYYDKTHTLVHSHHEICYRYRKVRLFFYSFRFYFGFLLCRNKKSISGSIKKRITPACCFRLLFRFLLRMNKKSIKKRITPTGNISDQQPIADIASVWTNVSEGGIRNQIMNESAVHYILAQGRKEKEIVKKMEI